MPVEEGLELVAAIRSDGPYAERELLDHVVDEVDGVRLRVAGIDLQRANSGRIVDRRVLIPAHRSAPFPLEGQELDVDLHVVAGHLLLVSMRVDGPPSNPIRESVEAMALADAVHGRVGRLDVVIALQVPDDANRAHVVRPT